MRFSGSLSSLSSYLKGAVVQLVPAENHRCDAILTGIPVPQSSGVVPLLIDRQIGEDVLLLFGFIGIGVQRKVVNGAKSDKT